MFCVVVIVVIAIVVVVVVVVVAISALDVVLLLGQVGFLSCVSSAIVLCCRCVSLCRCCVS